MAFVNYRELSPEPGEDIITYCERLEDMGYEEMFMRKAVRSHFGLAISELPELFEKFELARLRHITAIKCLGLKYKRTREGFARKVAGNLGLSLEEAQLWVDRFNEVGPQEYICSQDGTPVAP